jgi:hypothetical protein
MNKSEQYRFELQAESDPEAYLLSHCGLPGPRSNLELLYVAAELCGEETLRRWLDLTIDQAPENTPRVYLQSIAVVSLGRFILQHNDPQDVQKLRASANDERWRIRECTAMALQQIGKSDIHQLAKISEPWLDGTLHELRAVAAAWAEPCLLKTAVSQNTALTYMDRISQRFQVDSGSDKEARRILKNGLEYAWSVVVAANLPAGKALFEKWFFADTMMQKIMLANLKKNRLTKADPDWVQQLVSQQGTFSKQEN